MSSAGKILLVEDDANDIELTCAALTEKGLTNEVVVARDGEEALDYLYRRGVHASRDEGKPAIVLLDLKLPKLDGLEVLGLLKTEPTLKRIPVVMLTSSREERDVVDSYDLGANAYVVKPVAFENFVKVIGELGLFWIVSNQPPPEVEGGQL